jgi:signal transduction histidine kinase
VATASPFDAALGSVLERLRAATDELARHGHLPQLGERAIDLALALTGSAQAALALGSESAGYDSVFFHSLERAESLPDEAAALLLRAAGVGGSAAATREPKGAYPPEATIGADLRVGSHVVGAIAVARQADYTDADRQAFAIFAAQVAQAVGREEERRRQSVERLRTAERVERAHQLAVEVMLAVSSHAAKGDSLADFYRRLAGTLAELVDAKKVLFWRVGEDQMLVPAGGFGLSREFLASLTPVHLDPDGDDLASRVVHKDVLFRASNQSEEFKDVLDRLGVSSAISAPWRAGDKRFGLVAAYDSTRAGGFTREDTWVLHKAGLAAGLVTELWHVQEELRKSVDRLTTVDSARQLLLKNMTTAIEKERRRFISDLHDDTLQKLTAVELYLARISAGDKVELETLEKLSSLLDETESSLRRLLFDVRPPALEGPDGLAQSIRDRVAMLKGSGIQPQLDLDLPLDMSVEVKALLFRQVAEAVGNAERHSQATELKLVLRAEGGGVRGVVEDNGRGFSVVERSNLPGHLGLLALRERALMAGGWYRIDSQPGSGTHVEFWIPLNQ